MNEEILKEYTKSIILNILNKQDSSGYDISKNIEDNKINIKSSNLYLALKRMERDKLISSNWIEEKEMKIKKYSITQDGKEYLKNKKKEWNNNKVILDKLLGVK